MFLSGVLSNSQHKPNMAKIGSSFSNRAQEQPRVQTLTLLQAQQVVGGCSNPHGCLSVNSGVAVVSLRQPGVTDFAGYQRDWRLPINFPV